ncbi:MAG: nucleotide sugar dehydrogenase [Nitrospirae bacterium]|nr:MAG: nucleotide sugar dehydrogenase [Nitrospirota bacterium]
MRISIFGLGYVGCVTAACLSREGHEVIGVDVNELKVSLLNEGQCPIIEKGLPELIRAGRNQGRLSATTDVSEAIQSTTVSLICVGTPSQANGSLDLSHIKQVSQEIGVSLKEKESYHCFIYRSTVLPQTTRTVIIPVLEEASGKQAHIDFDVCFNPEFLREGTSVHDFYHPPLTIIGHQTARGASTAAELYESIPAPIEYVSYEIAEMMKYVSNTFHALKVAFANEIGTICKAIGVDSYEVMRLFCMDTKLNVSPAYLKPGFGFGGSCLPKDLRALVYKARDVDVYAPVLGSILESNRLHIQRAVDYLVRKRVKKVGVLGLSFKEGTDDLRESPTVVLIEQLIGKGFDVRIYDPEVYLAKLHGANKDYIQREIPHIATLVSDNLPDVIQSSDLLVVAKALADFDRDVKPFLGDKPVYDLVRIRPQLTGMPSGYEGICW